MVKNEQLDRNPKQLKHLKSVIMVKFAKITIGFRLFLSFLHDKKANIETKKPITPVSLATYLQKRCLIAS